MTSSPNSPTLDKLRNISSTLVELRKATDSAEALRDELVRELYKSGKHSAINLAKAGGFTRGRIYQIMREVPVDAEDTEFAAFAERFDAAVEHAADEYFRAGSEGSVDDFFPLDLLLRERA